MACLAAVFEHRVMTEICSKVEAATCEIDFSHVYMYCAQASICISRLCLLGLPAENIFIRQMLKGVSVLPLFGSMSSCIPSYAFAVTNTVELRFDDEQRLCL